MNELEKTALSHALETVRKNDYEDVFDFFVDLLHKFVDAKKELEGN